MPASPLPIIVILSIAACVAAAVLMSKLYWRIALALLAASAYLGPVSLEMYRGYRLRVHADSGCAEAQFLYSRWVENHLDRLTQTVPWFGRHRFEESWLWLTSAAEKGHPEAIYAVAVRRKYGMFVPEPQFQQQTVARDQVFVSPSYRPRVPEEQYYWRRFRSDERSEVRALRCNE